MWHEPISIAIITLRDRMLDDRLLTSVYVDQPDEWIVDHNKQMCGCTVKIASTECSLYKVINLTPYFSHGACVLSFCPVNVGTRLLVALEVGQRPGMFGRAQTCR